MHIFSGNANPALSQKIAEHVGQPLGRVNIERFPDGEIFVKIEENIRGQDVFFIQPTCNRPNDYLMELLLMMDAISLWIWRGWCVSLGRSDQEITLGALKSLRDRRHRIQNVLKHFNCSHRSARTEPRGVLETARQQIARVLVLPIEIEPVVAHQPR